MPAITDQEIRNLRERNEVRAAAAREKMGERHVFHHCNQVKRARYHSVLQVGRQLDGFLGIKSK